MRIGKNELKEEFRKHIKDTNGEDVYNSFIDTELEESCISFIEKQMNIAEYKQLNLSTNPAYIGFLDTLNKLMESKSNNLPEKKRF